MTVEFGIREIKELEFFVDETKDIDDSFDFNYNVDILPDTKTELIRFIVTASYMSSPGKELFLKGKVMTVFSVNNMKAFAKIKNGKEGLDIPEVVWVTFFSIAFTHTRAILGRSSAGSKFMNLLMPVINPQQEFQKLFGKLLHPETTK